MATSTVEDSKTYTKTSVIDDLANLGEKVKNELDALEERRQTIIEAHRRELNDLQSEQAKLRRVLRAIGQADKLPSPKRRSRSTPPAPGRTGMGVSVSKAATVARTIRTYCTETGNDTFSALDIRRFDGGFKDPSTIYPAFNYLRSIEFIGKAGRKGNSDQWRILDNQAIDKVLEEMNAR